MNIKSIFVIFAIICIAQEISSTFTCNCMGQGKDVCSCNQKVKAHRPFPTPAPAIQPRFQKTILKTICKDVDTSPPEPLKAIGDICNCGQTIVKPAPYPVIKPCPCQKSLHFPKIEFKQHSSCSCSACTSQKHTYESREHEKCDGCGELKRAPKQYYFEFEGKDQSEKYEKSSPKNVRYGNADIVSVSIAQRLANSAKYGVSERQLQYGSQKEPIQNQKKDEKKGTSVHEDHLYTTKGHVLELKSNLFQKHDSSSESSSESEQSPRKRKEFTPANLKYDEIGYGAYHSQNPKYIVVKNKEANHDCSNKENQRKHHHHKNCGCAQDLIVEASSISENSHSYDDEADQYTRQRSYFST